MMAFNQDSTRRKVDRLCLWWLKIRNTGGLPQKIFGIIQTNCFLLGRLGCPKQSFLHWAQQNRKSALWFIERSDPRCRTERWVGIPSNENYPVAYATLLVLNNLILTLQLLHQLKKAKNLHNHYLILVLCCIISTFGQVGMHKIQKHFQIAGNSETHWWSVTAYYIHRVSSYCKWANHITS